MPLFDISKIKPRKINFNNEDEMQAEYKQI